MRGNKFLDASNKALCRDTLPGSGVEGTSGPAEDEDTSGTAVVEDTPGAAVAEDTSRADVADATSGAAVAEATSGVAGVTDTSGVATGISAASSPGNTTGIFANEAVQIPQVSSSQVLSSAMSWAER